MVYAAFSFQASVAGEINAVSLYLNAHLSGYLSERRGWEVVVLTWGYWMGKGLGIVP